MKNNLVKYIFFVFIIVILIFAIVKMNTSSSQNTNEQEENQKATQEITKEINLAIASFDTINPILSTNQDVQDIAKLVYEPLVNLTSEYKAEPCLATEWAKTDDTTYIIKLREDVLWSNGEKFTGEDVRFTIDRLKEISSVYSYNVQYVIEVEVVDEYTVRITLDKAIPFFEYNLTFPIMCKSYYEGEDFQTTDKNTTPIGTGMFKVSEVQDSNLILEKNENWWNISNKDSVLEKIVIDINSSKAEIYSSFKMGNIDLISTSSINYEDYIGTMGYRTREYAGREHEFLAINTQNQILSDVGVRQAISYAIDKESIISSVFEGEYYTADFPLAFGSWLDDTENSGYTYSTELAIQSLENAGWTYKNNYWQKTENNRTQTLSINLLVKGSDSNRVQTANIIKEQLEQVGIVVNLKSVSDSQYESDMSNKNYDIVLTGTTVSASPDLSTYFGSDNLANYTNEEVTEILQEVNNTTDESILEENYARLKEIYKTEVPYISLYFNKCTVAYSTNLTGEVTSNWFNLFYNIENWYK